MGKLQTGRFERLGARTYSIKGPGALVDLDETVLGVILLERQGGMESHLIQDWRTFGREVSDGAVAAEYSWVGIHNPANSNQLIVVDRFARATASYMRVFRGAGIPPPFGVTSIGEGLDTRIGTGHIPAAQLIRCNSNISTFGTQIAAFSTNSVIDWPLVIAEDGSFFWRSGSVSETIELSLYWSEREAAPFEMS